MNTSSLLYFYFTWLENILRSKHLLHKQNFIFIRMFLNILIFISRTKNTLGTPEVQNKSPLEILNWCSTLESPTTPIYLDSFLTYTYITSPARDVTGICPRERPPRPPPKAGDGVGTPQSKRRDAPGTASRSWELWRENASRGKFSRYKSWISQFLGSFSLKLLSLGFMWVRWRIVWDFCV